MEDVLRTAALIPQTFILIDQRGNATTFVRRLPGGLIAPAPAKAAVLLGILERQRREFARSVIPLAPLAMKLTPTAACLAQAADFYTVANVF